MKTYYIIDHSCMGIVRINIDHVATITLNIVKTEDTVEFINFHVDSEYQHNGYGSYLLRAAINYTIVVLQPDRVRVLPEPFPKDIETSDKIPMYKLVEIYSRAGFYLPPTDSYKGRNYPGYMFLKRNVDLFNLHQLHDSSQLTRFGRRK
jgi:GNAT superfamily N-acetyltransferase